ncbi:MAG: hypothetical protein R3277_01930 [Brumimicrobium sp.]|nr:hypothetical protein [Brumimicrobium sp.]
MKRLIVLFLFFYHCAPAQSSSADLLPEVLALNIIEPAENKIEKLGKFETGFNLPKTLKNQIDDYLFGRPHKRGGINPFVSWDLDVQARFVHLQSGKIHDVTGFFYRAMKRDLKSGQWEEAENNYPVRIRFAPPLEGKWKMDVKVIVKGKETYHSESLYFEVLSSENKGYVRMHKDKQFFERDGEIIYPTGTNLPFPIVDNNMFYSKNPKDVLNLNAWVQFREMVSRYALEGGKYFRFFLNSSSTDFEFEELGYYYDRQHFAWEVDRMLEICEENDLLVDFNMMHHAVFMKLGDYYQFNYDFSDYWPGDYWPYRDLQPVSGYSILLNSKQPSDMFLKEESLRYLKEKVRYIMARWGYSTAISYFEVMSEPWHIDEHWMNHDIPYDSLGEDGDRARRAAYNYHSVISEYFKDSIRNVNHLLGAVGRFPVGTTDIFSHNMNKKIKNIDSTWFLDDIDFLSISYYTPRPEKLLISKSGAKNNRCEEGENSAACTIERLQRTYQKPVMFGESDHGDNTPICAELLSHRIDLMRYAFLGAAGHYTWSGFNYPDTSSSHDHPQDERLIWPKIINAKDFYNESWHLDLIENFGQQGREKSKIKGYSKDLKEHQYIINTAKTKIGGYIYNRTFNVYTASGEMEKAIDSTSTCFLKEDYLRKPVEITWKPSKMKIEGVKPLRKYRIYYYGFNRGSFLNVITVRASLFGKLKLVHPSMEAHKNDNPLVWYRAELFPAAD